jgi:hypothetical protein
MRRAPLSPSRRDRRTATSPTVPHAAGLLTAYPAGTVVVHKLQHFLIWCSPNQGAVRYGTAVGDECADLAGVLRVIQ